MSFLVTFKGQFRPYKLPDDFHYQRINRLSHAEKEHKIKRDDEEPFKEHLHLEGETKTSKSLKAYKKNVPKKTNLNSHSSRDIMTHSLKTLKEDDTVATGLELMEKEHIHHIPILNNENTLVGIISDKDLIVQTNKSKKLRDIMHKEIIACYEETKIQILTSVMLHESVHCMPVLNPQNQLIGIVTQTDILKAVLNSNILETWA